MRACHFTLHCTHSLSSVPLKTSEIAIQILNGAMVKCYLVHSGARRPGPLPARRRGNEPVGKWKYTMKV